jgi:hypothetical protein
MNKKRSESNGGEAKAKPEDGRIEKRHRQSEHTFVQRAADSGWGTRSIERPDSEIRL